MKLTVTKNLQITDWIPGILKPEHTGHYQRDRKTRTPRPAEFFHPKTANDSLPSIRLQRTRLQLSVRLLIWSIGTDTRGGYHLTLDPELSDHMKALVLKHITGEGLNMMKANIRKQFLITKMILQVNRIGTLLKMDGSSATKL